MNFLDNQNKYLLSTLGLFHTVFMSAKYTPQQVANYFIIKARNEKHPLTLMQLLKLVYIAYAWYLAIEGDALFNEKIEAWGYGPVVPSLYHEFKRFGSKPISPTSDEIFARKDIEIKQSDFIQEYEENVLGILESVWGMYGSLDGLELSNITHENIAWRNAWNKGRNTPLNNDDVFQCAKIGIEKYRLKLKQENIKVST